MKIRALKTTIDLRRGLVGEFDDYRARELIALGYAIEVLPLDKQEAAPIAANDNIPFVVRPTGGLTGADVPRSLSPEGQVQPQRELSERAESPESGSSQSTADTNSLHGQTSSTPATTTGGKRKRGRPRSKG